MAGSYYDDQNSNNSGTDSASILYWFAIVFGVILLLFLFHARRCLRSSNEEPDDDPAGRCMNLPPNSGRGDRVPPRQQQPAATEAVDVEMAPPGEPPVVSTYRKADGWPEATCAVCLAELTDGVNVRVLPVCMHYFHASCVGEWLLAHQTCPICRAPLHPVAGAEFPPA